MKMYENSGEWCDESKGTMWGCGASRCQSEISCSNVDGGLWRVGLGDEGGEEDKAEEMEGGRCSVDNRGPAPRKNGGGPGDEADRERSPSPTREVDPLGRTLIPLKLRRRSVASSTVSCRGAWRTILTATLCTSPLPSRGRRLASRTTPNAPLPISRPSVHPCTTNPGWSPSASIVWLEKALRKSCAGDQTAGLGELNVEPAGVGSSSILSGFGERGGVEMRRRASEGGVCVDGAGARAEPIDWPASAALAQTGTHGGAARAEVGTAARGAGLEAEPARVVQLKRGIVGVGVRERVRQRLPRGSRRGRPRKQRRRHPGRAGKRKGRDCSRLRHSRPISLSCPPVACRTSTGESMVLTLTYFDVRGRGEPILLLLVDSGVNFEHEYVVAPLNAAHFQGDDERTLARAEAGGRGWASRVPVRSPAGAHILSRRTGRERHQAERDGCDSDVPRGQARIQANRASRLEYRAGLT